MLCLMISMLAESVGGEHGVVSEAVRLFVALLGFAVTVGVLTKFIRIPYTVAQRAATRR